VATSRQADVLVIGAGVSGLTTALRFVERGRSVRVLAELPARQTTSACAGASWGPYLVRDDERVLAWSERTRLVLEEIARDPASGVRLTYGVEASIEYREPPSWAYGVPDYRLFGPADLPTGYKSGWGYRVPLVDMPRYLDYLVSRLTGAGVDVEIRSIRSLTEVAGEAAILVNCSGLGARDLVPDEDVFPIRGQLVVVENPGIDAFFQDDAEDGDLTYILPHGNRVVLGGSAIPGRRDIEPDLGLAHAIIERCAAVEPRLRNPVILRHLVGFRPTRPAVRVEREDVSGTVLIHNYGHGGSGITLSWGCADEVLRLAGLA
jgi:D-amino-acid oxidase